MPRHLFPSLLSRFSIFLSLAWSALASAQSAVAFPDSGKAYSPDSSLVVFVRATPRRTVATGRDSVEATELWIAQRNGTRPRRLIVGRGAKDMRFVLAGMHSPTFSADGRRVFFMTAAWATSDAIHVVSLATGRHHYVAPGNSLEVIRGGRYRGCLLVEQHRYWMSGGSYDWLWLMTESGQDIAPVAEPDSEDSDSRIAEWRRIFGVDSNDKRRRSCAAPPNER